ncbi:MAG: hypothetical protein JJU41_00065 [Bacteroidetes bacterium]|nr:hypothetical protein [Bacteroidota bacterium]MCH8525435.1 hypothetical protein [Balneolales bacterium]
MYIENNAWHRVMSFYSDGADLHRVTSFYDEIAGWSHPKHLNPKIKSAS